MVRRRTNLVGYGTDRYLHSSLIRAARRESLRSRSSDLSKSPLDRSYKRRDLPIASCDYRPRSGRRRRSPYCWLGLLFREQGAIVSWTVAVANNHKGGKSLPSPAPQQQSCVDVEKCGSIASAIPDKVHIPASRHLPSSCLNTLPTRDHTTATASIKANHLPSRLPNRHTDISIPRTFQSLLLAQLLLRTTPHHCTNSRGSLDSVWIPIATFRKARLTTTRCKSRVLGLVARLPRARPLASHLFPVLGVTHRRLSKTISRRP